MITRVDLEAVGSTIFRKNWEAGWIEGDAPASTETFEGATVFSLLRSLELNGFTVEMHDDDHGRALRGQITRIDFSVVGPQVVVRKWPYGWTASTRPISTETKTGFDLENALDWCLKNGWTVYRYEGGARAWLGQALPVRDAASIRRLRARMPRTQFDLAFYF